MSEKNPGQEINDIPLPLDSFPEMLRNQFLLYINDFPTNEYEVIFGILKNNGTPEAVIRELKRLLPQNRLN